MSRMEKLNKRENWNQKLNDFQLPNGFSSKLTFQVFFHFNFRICEEAGSERVII